MAQNALSVVTQVRAERLNALEMLLGEIGDDIQNNRWVPFPRFETLHFACWIVLKRDSNFPLRLVLETSFDGTLDAHLDEWIQRAAGGLHEIYSQCEGYPATEAVDPMRLKQFLLAHRVE